MVLAPKNMMVTQDDTYQILSQVEYALSTGSTVVVEAIQKGVKTFVLDVETTLGHFYLRDFSTLCVLTGDEVIQRIENIEAGNEEYRFNSYADLIDLSGSSPVNIIRHDIGLSPIDNGTTTS